MARISETQYIKALEAYKRNVNQNKNIKSSGVTNPIKNNLAALNVGHVDKTIFAQALGDAVRAQATKIRTGERKTKEALTKRTSLIDVVSAINESEVALQTIVTIRDKLISAYQDILKMPI